MTVERGLLSVSLLVAMILVLALVGLTSYGVYNPFPVRQILDVSFLVGAVFFVFRCFTVETFVYQFTLIFLVLVSFLWMRLAESGGFLDFVLIYKYYIYLIFLLPYCGRRIFPLNFSFLIFKILLLIFLLKYIVWIFIGFNERPGVYGENNFELIFLIMLYVSCLSRGGAVPASYTFILAVVCLLSQSRSALVVLLFVLVALNVKRIDVRSLVVVILSLVFSILIVGVFSDRLGDKGIVGIDRIRFLLYFREEISGFGIWEFFFGADPITPLSYATCSALESYERLFSYSESNTCYSVILHSFNLRVLFDHGLVGFIFVFFVVYRMMKLSGLTVRYGATVCMIVLLTGMSISSLNNIFVVAGLLFTMVTFKND